MEKKNFQKNFSGESNSPHTLRIVAIVIIIVAAVAGSGLFLFQKRVHRAGETSKTSVPVSQVDVYRDRLPDLEKEAKENPDNENSVREYAVALYATGDTEKAKEQYLAELKLNDKDPVLHNNLGNVYRDSRQYEEAIKSYQKAIELDPKNATPYINLAHLYIYTLEKTDFGIEVYNRAIEENPDNADLPGLLANTYEQIGNYAKAREAYENMLEKNPDNAVAKAGLERLSESHD